VRPPKTKRDEYRCLQHGRYNPCAREKLAHPEWEEQKEESSRLRFSRTLINFKTEPYLLLTGTSTSLNAEYTKLTTVKP